MELLAKYQPSVSIDRIYRFLAAWIFVATVLSFKGSDGPIDIISQAISALGMPVDAWLEAAAVWIENNAALMAVLSNLTLLVSLAACTSSISQYTRAVATALLAFSTGIATGQGPIYGWIAVAIAVVVTLFLVSSPNSSTT
jgi:hypothetical protein